jgi:hypothetical protein
VPIGQTTAGEHRLAGGAMLAGDGYNARAYGSWRVRPQFLVEGLVGYGSASYGLMRGITAYDTSVTANCDASHWFGSLGVTGNVTLGRTSLLPYLHADCQAVTFDGYREHTNSSLVRAGRCGEAWVTPGAQAQDKSQSSLNLGTLWRAARTVPAGP